MRSALVIAGVLGCGPPIHHDSVANTTPTTAPVAVDAPVASARPSAKITNAVANGTELALTIPLGTSDGLERSSKAHLHALDGRDLGEVVLARVSKHESVWVSTATMSQVQGASIVVDVTPM